LGPAAFHCQQAVEKMLARVADGGAYPERHLCGKRRRACPPTLSKSVTRVMHWKFRWERLVKPLRQQKRYGILSWASYHASSQSPGEIRNDRYRPPRRKPLS
jgi:hypothetical protein